MKNIIPFKKDVIFKTNISEITSISLEHTLNIKEDEVEGDFIVSGEYKITDNSSTVEPFNFKLPFKIIVGDYDISSATLDIDDFYYEIVNDNVLNVSIDVLLDKIKEKELVEERNEELPDLSIEYDTFDEDINEEDLIIEEERECDNIEVKEKIDSIFSKVATTNDYVSYNVYIIRDGDTIESILDKYNVSKEVLESYNDLSDLKLGDKLIIPDNERY